jgi:hypothetical protein
VVETDVADCFSSIPHTGLMSAVEERISDRRLLALLRAFLRAGVMEQGSVRRPVTGTPQGGVIRLRQDRRLRADAARPVHREAASTWPVLGFRPDLPVTQRARPDLPQWHRRRTPSQPGLAGSGRTPPVKDVGEPCAGEPYARFDGRWLETERVSVTAPAPDPTNLEVVTAYLRVVTKVMSANFLLAASRAQRPCPGNGQ